MINENRQDERLLQNGKPKRGSRQSRRAPVGVVQTYRGRLVALVTERGCRNDWQCWLRKRIKTPIRIFCKMIIADGAISALFNLTGLGREVDVVERLVGVKQLTGGNEQKDQQQRAGNQLLLRGCFLIHKAKVKKVSIFTTMLQKFKIASNTNRSG
jgi:hypothetical protein